MGMMLSVRAEIQGQGLFRLKPRHAATLELVHRGFQSVIADPLTSMLFRTLKHRDEYLTLQLHPAADPLYFDFDEGVLCCQASTHAAGPGYHAYLIETLEQVARECHFTWYLASDDGDTTGFWHHRDFSLLQESMARWLQGLARSVAAQQATGLLISLPEGFRPVADAYALTPLGPRPREWFARAATAGDAELFSLAADFFPWWNAGLTAECWRNIGLVLSWCEVPWHPPASTDERRLYNIALAAFQFAQSRSLPVPEAAIAEMIRITAMSPDAPLPPAPEGLGYLRSQVAITLYGGWTITLPGYFYRRETENGDMVFWYGDRTIHCTTLTAAKEDVFIPIDDLFTATQSSLPAEHQQYQELAHDLQRGWRAEAYATINADTYHSMHGAWAVDGHACVLTICYETPDDAAWADTVWRSIWWAGPVREFVEVR